MSPAERVVVGYDGGPTGEDALAFARRWARATGDEVVVATVHAGAAPVGPQRVDAEWAAYERSEAEALLERARELMGDVPTTLRRIDAGSAARGLHELAEEDSTGTPLLVVGTRRKGEAHRTRPGTTGDRLLHGTPVPVAVVPHDYAEDPDHDLDEVVLAYVDTPDGHAALEAAIRIAQHLGATLHIVTVVPQTGMVVSEPTVFRTDRDRGYQEALDEAVAQASAAGLTADGQLLRGSPVDELRRIGTERGQLLVCGSRGYGPVRSVLLGGVSGRVVRGATLPVIVVPRGG